VKREFILTAPIEQQITLGNIGNGGIHTFRMFCGVQNDVAEIAAILFHSAVNSRHATRPAITSPLTLTYFKARTSAIWSECFKT